MYAYFPRGWKYSNLLGLNLNRVFRLIVELKLIQNGHCVFFLISIQVLTSIILFGYSHKAVFGFKIFKNFEIEFK